MKNKLLDVVVVIGMGLFFFLIHFVTSYMFYTIMPAEHFIEVDKFIANDVNLSKQNYTEVLFYRTSSHSIPSKTYTELTMIDNNTNSVIFIASADLLYESGYKEFRIPFNMGDTSLICSGTYYWQMNINMELKYGIRKTLELQTNNFKIYH